MDDLVSIITPTYNSAKYIAETIKSVQNQSYTHWEMLIVDDASADETCTIINSFAADKRVLLFKNKENQGPGYSRQKALNEAKGKYIAFLDADDLWHEEKLGKQIRFLKTNHLPFTFCFYRCIDEQGQALNQFVSAPNPLTLNQLKYCNHIGNLTGIYDADFLGKINISEIRKRQDWIMWLDILKEIKVAYPVPEYLAFYRLRKNSLSANKLNLLKHNFNVYRLYWKDGYLVAFFKMIVFLFHQLVLKRRFIKKLANH